MIFIIILTLFFYLGAEAGASWPWSPKWQTNKFKKKLPELCLSFLIAGFSVSSYAALGLSEGWQSVAFIVAFMVALAGIESATWSFLRWNPGAWDHPEDRSYTLKPIVDWIAKRFNVTLGQETYSWISATVKGTIITLPLGGLGGLFFAFGYEIGSHAKGRVTKFNPHIISEGMSFLLVGAYALFVYSLCTMVGS